MYIRILERERDGEGKKVREEKGKKAKKGIRMSATRAKGKGHVLA